MEPIFWILNAVFGAVGFVLLLIANKYEGWRRFTIGMLGGFVMIASALLLPSTLLQKLTQTSETATDETSDDDASMDDSLAVVPAGESGHTVIITKDQDLVGLLTRAIQDQRDASASQEDVEPVETVEAPTSVTTQERMPGRDPLSSWVPVPSGTYETPTPAPTPEPTASPTPEPTPSPTPAPTPAPPVRVRSLPPEVEEPAACTNFKLLHGDSGGPEPDGCFAVGCAQGYAIPMFWAVGSWQACHSYTRLPRLNDCYFVVDSDGTERSMHMVDNQWKPGCK